MLGITHHGPAAALALCALAGSPAHAGGTVAGVEVDGSLMMPTLCPNVGSAGPFGVNTMCGMYWAGAGISVSVDYEAVDEANMAFGGRAGFDTWRFLHLAPTATTHTYYWSDYWIGLELSPGIALDLEVKRFLPYGRAALRFGQGWRAGSVFVQGMPAILRGDGYFTVGMSIQLLTSAR